jgi:hypothetical protein
MLAAVGVGSLTAYLNPQPVVSSTFQSKLSSKAPNEIGGTFCWKLSIALQTSLTSSGSCCWPDMYQSYLSQVIYTEKVK